MTLSSPLASYDELNAEVTKLAQKLDWESAARLCDDFLKTVQDSDRNRVLELLGDCYYNQAFQQSSRDNFKKIILRAKEEYERAPDYFRCKTRASFCEYWASDNPEERRRLIFDECIPLGREVLAHSKSSGHMLSRAYSELCEYLIEGITIASDRQHLEEFAKEGKLVGKNGLDQFKDSEVSESLILVAYSYLDLLAGPLSGIFLEDEKEYAQMSIETDPIGNKLAQIAEKLENPRIRTLAYETAGCVKAEFKHDFVSASSLFEKALIEAEKTKDIYLVGRQSFWLGYSLSWLYITIDDFDQRKQILERGQQYLRISIENLKIPLVTAFLSDAFFWICGNLNESARLSEEVTRKIDILNHTIALGREGLSWRRFRPINSGFYFGEAARYEVDLLSDSSEREKLLLEAARLAEEEVKQYELLTDMRSWNYAVALNSLGAIKCKIADEKADPSEKLKVLKEGCSILSKGFDIQRKSPALRGRESVVAEVTSQNLGPALTKIYELSQNVEDCISAIKAYETVIDMYGALNMSGLMAPIYWKIAKLYDRISEYEKSARAFSKAADLYAGTAISQKSVSKSFNDLASFMRAWSKIEEARLDHRDEKYSGASGRLREAASILEKSESYKDIAKHYEAYSKAEDAEDLSRKERNIEATSAFEKASQLFEDAEKNMTILAREGKSFDSELKDWANLSRQRSEYCITRKELEEARAFDRNGQPEPSMRKYRSAANDLRQLLQGMSEQDMRELDALALSCDAWATMKEAEYSSSPELYSNASGLFLKAKDKKVRQSFVLSCLANASMCEALSAGTAFKRSSDVQLYSEIKTKLGAASRYFEEAGFEIASDWTRATEALFDALAYLAGAEREIDPQKKTQMYHLAEKHLELSARRYGDIGYDKKRQEVLKHLKTARENRELLLTPMEALAQSPTVSASPVNFSGDQALGVERFEVANLTGNMSLSVKMTNVGSSIRIDIDIANVGKTPALLMKLDGVAPSHSFEPETEKNPHHFLEGAGLIAVDLKGRRLEYLKAHEMSLHLIARNKGTFEIKPKVLFVDELGKYRSYEFEPQSIEVKELGFMGWAKGK